MKYNYSTKKPLSNFGVTPLHCAAINPDPKFLKSLLNKFADYNYRDGRERRIVHYAAACKENTLCLGDYNFFFNIFFFKFSIKK